MSFFSPLKEAWRTMYQSRTCPPFAVLSDPQHAENVAKHCTGCPLCALAAQDKAQTKATAWAELGQRLIQDLPAPVTPLAVQPGQIWSLKTSKGGWDTRWRYLNPPLVLVLEVLAEVQGVRVAQVFDQPELAASGDIFLGEGLGLAQAWNTYALDRFDLDLCLATVSADLVQQVQDLVDTDLSQPEEGTTLWHFRQLELELGAAMATTALGQLMQRHDRHAIRQLLADTARVRAQISNIHPDIVLPDTAENGLVLLAQAKWPEQRLAAAENTQCSLIVVTVGQSTAPCRQALATLDRASLDASTLRVGGVVPEDARAAYLFAWWSRADMGMTEGEVYYDQPSGRFRADFADKTQLDFQLGRLMLVAVDTEDGHP